MPARALFAYVIVVAALCGGAGHACAQGQPLDDKALSATWGQALLDLTNTDQGGYQFSRVTLNADITMSSTLTGLKLGTYAYNGVPGSDIDIGRMSFGRSDLGDASRTVAITNPFFEWVYSGTANTADRQVVGMRLGFGGISGDVGLQMNTVSGSLKIDLTGNGDFATLNGARSSTLGSMPLTNIGGVTAGDATGASSDFFISLLKAAVTFPTTNANGTAPAQAQAGFWLNWTDRLKAINTTGFVPPNVPKTGP
jgi:hypothetical protein